MSFAAKHEPRSLFRVLSHTCLCFFTPARLESFQRFNKYHEKPEDKDMLDEKEILYKLLPVAFLFMMCVFGASAVGFVFPFVLLSSFLHCYFDAVFSLVCVITKKQ